MTREEFGAEVAKILTAEQREEIGRLHGLVEESAECFAAELTAPCCVDEIAEACG